MSYEKFAISEIMPGKLNSMVKNIMSQMKVNDPDEAVRRVNSGEWIVVESPILEFIGTVDVSATTSQFVARDKFVVNTDDDAEVKISGMGSNFKNWLLGKTEEPIARQTLRYAKLRKSSVDTPIIAGQGGEEKSETTLTEMFSLMKKQRDGKTGALLTNGYANILYIRDISGVLRAVSVYWYGHGCYVYAYEVSFPSEWYAGDQVFSRKPLETQVAA